MSLDPVTAALDLGGKLIERFFPDPAQRDAAKLQLLTLQQNGELAQMTGQLDINKVEAASTNWFVAGWRPFAGWIGGIGLLYSVAIEPILRFIAMVLYNYTGSFPIIDTTITVQVLLGMLGLGGLRTYEKLKNVSTK